jgi:predicted  nucleic acid-binding Zn-ribbon protein
MANKPSNNVEAEPDDSQAGTELTQLREILFGQTNRAFKADLASLESRINDNFATLNNQLEVQFNDIRKLIDNQVQDLSHRLEGANSSNSNVQNQLQATTDKLQSELEIAETSAKNDNDALEAHVVKELDSLENVFSKRHQELLERLQQVTSELSETKTDRKTLANLLSTMASNLATDQ